MEHSYLKAKIKDDDNMPIYWLNNLPIGLLLTGKDGQIYWTNLYLQNLLEYTHNELLDITWKDLTIGARDLLADEVMVEELYRGDRPSYSLIKTYSSKTRRSIPVRITVFRYPVPSETDPALIYFLVAVVPLNIERDVVLEAIDALSKKVAVPSLGNAIEGFVGWARVNPKVAWIMGAALGLILWGQGFVEFVELLRKLLAGT